MKPFQFSFNRCYFFAHYRIWNPHADIKTKPPLGPLLGKERMKNLLPRGRHCHRCETEGELYGVHQYVSRRIDAALTQSMHSKRSITPTITPSIRQQTDTPLTGRVFVFAIPIYREKRSQNQSFALMRLPRRSAPCNDSDVRVRIQTNCQIVNH